jgi:hypothetical protein
MFRKLSLLLIVVAPLAVFSAPLQAEPVLLVTTVDTHGQTEEYLNRLDRTLAIAKRISPAATWRIWVAAVSGTATGDVYVTVEFSDMAAYAEGTERQNASKEFNDSIAALAEMGREIVSRSMLVDTTR